MIIDCISDLHGYFPKLEGGDLLIVAGDLTKRDLETEHALFDYWINEQLYRMKVVISGNHDNTLQEKRLRFQFCEYLCDSGTEFEGLKIWGSPWTTTFPGMNPHCKAFTYEDDEEMKEKWDLIPADVDILVTHSPPRNVLDRTIDGRNVGSSTLLHSNVPRKHTLKLHVFGHIHEAYGVFDLRKIQTIKGDKHTPIFVNASHVNERYNPINPPIRIEL